MASYRGKIITTGRSEAIRFDNALFKSLPAFRQRAQVRAHVLGPHSFLVTLDEAVPKPDEDELERDPVVAAVLDFLERDMRNHPERLTPFTEAEIARVYGLTEGVSASDDDIIPDDVTL